MAKLDYQNFDDTRREHWREYRLQLFGGERENILRRLAEEIYARYESEGPFGPNRVVAAVGPWEIVLDIEGGRGARTRLRAPYVNADGFQFRLYRVKRWDIDLGKLLGAQDIEIGDEEFDRDFIVKSNNEARVKALLASEKLRFLIDQQPYVSFCIRDDDGFFGPRFLPGVDQLCLVTPGAILDLDRLRGLVDLLTETLWRLCEIGSAYDVKPRVEL